LLEGFALADRWQIKGEQRHIAPAGVAVLQRLPQQGRHVVVQLVRLDRAPLAEPRDAALVRVDVMCDGVVKDGAIYLQAEA
jgi:hypothetical protein